MSAGSTGLGQIEALTGPGGQLSQQFTGINPNDVSSTPEYQFLQQQGLKSLQQSAAASGALQTGGTLKAITQYGQGLASTAYQQAYNNALSTFNVNRQGALAQLSGSENLAGYGQTASGQTLNSLAAFTNPQASNLYNSGVQQGNWQVGAGDTSAGYTFQAANNAANLRTGAAAATAGGIVGGSNALTGGIQGATGAFGQSLSAYFNPYASNGSSGAYATPGAQPGQFGWGQVPNSPTAYPIYGPTTPAG